MKSILPILFFIFGISSLHAQKIAIPISSYGIWDRGNILLNDPTNQKYKYFRGAQVEIKWSDLQAKDSLQYNWALFDDMITIAATNNILIFLDILVGPDCPAWLYANGVPSVATTDGQHSWPQYPYYLSSNYQRHFYKMIADYGKHLRTLSSNSQKCISFMQVMNGCTGDECAYKGTPLNNQYTITDAQWLNFRLNSFSKFKAAFHDGDTTTAIPMLFNNIDPSAYPTEWKWCTDSIGSGFGVKSSASIRGHHLTGDLSFKTSYSPLLYNQKGLSIFSRSEMDQGCTQALFTINPPLAYYWANLNGLDTGTGIHDISKNASTDVTTYPDVMQSMLFYNKYAGQITGSTTVGAYSVFHEGLNAMNTSKFSEATYGKCQMLDTARYVKICTAYAARGAQIDDLYAMLQGNVYQRASQTGYNDVGWDIEEGNYERWMSQINADATSIGLFRVRGPLTAASSKYDRFARSFENKSGKNTMFFQFWNEVFSTTKPKTLTFTVTWLDKTKGSTWCLQYKNALGLQSVLKTTGIGDNTWKTVTTTINDMDVSHTANANGADFMLVNTDAIDDIFNGIEVDIARQTTQTALPEITNNKDESGVQLFPNPTNSVVNIQSSEEIKSVELYDLSGKIIMKQWNAMENSIDLSAIQNGLYLLRIELDHQVVVRKITKE